jgi:hypothetical protein
MSHTPGPWSVMENLELYDFIVQLKMLAAAEKGTTS